MSRYVRSISALCSRAVTALGAARGPQAPAQAMQAAAQLQGARQYAVITGAAGAGVAKAVAGSLGSTMTLKVMGYNVPYPFIIGSALAVAGGVYWWESLHVAREKDAPLQAYLEAAPHIRSLEMTTQEGRTFTASDLTGKWALMTFGTVSPSDIEALSAMAKAADTVKQKSGSAVVPVFISLDASKDKPADLKKMVQSSGSPEAVALTGDADGLLSCANKFKKQEMSIRATATADQESVKHGDTVDPSYVSSYVYIVSPSGDFVSMMSKNLPAEKMANQICLQI